MHLRLLGSWRRVPVVGVTLQLAVESAIIEAAPEIVIIDVENRPRSRGRHAVPVTIGRKVAHA